jgi:glutamine---fructose-6-phosphate transaminase (isomerizing)
MIEVRDTLMFAEAGEAGATIARQLADRAAITALGARLRATPPPLVATCARGSSDHAATFAKYLIETHAGTPVVSSAPSVASIYHAAPRMAGALCLAISQSGRSPDLIATATAAREAGAIVAALVNDETSPLATDAHVLIPLRAGQEKSVAATKSFIGACGAILDLIAAWTDDAALAADVATLPARLADAWSLDWSGLVDALVSAEGLYVVGRGIGLGIAQEAALKFKETCGLHAEAFSAAELRHGPIALVGPNLPVLLFRQEDGTDKGVDALIDDVLARGGSVIVAGDAPAGAIALPVVDAPAVLQPALQIQSFYRAVATLSVRRGYDPDHPISLRKVTETL